MTSDQRKDIRQKIDLVATLRMGDTSHDILITDISLGGMKIELRKNVLAIEPQENVILDIPLFNEIHCIIAWAHNSHHGVSFQNCPGALKAFIKSILPQPEDDFDALPIKAFA